MKGKVIMENMGYRFGFLLVIINGLLIMGNAVFAAGIGESENVGRIVDEENRGQLPIRRKINGACS